MAWDDDFEPGLLDRFIQIESGGNPYARTGSYKGLFQLSDDEFARWGGRGQNIYDPDANRRAAERKLRAEREWFRDRYDRDPTATDLYMMHQQGQAGYAQHLANPELPAWQNMFATGEGRQKGANWARQAIWGNIPDADKRRFGNVNNVTSEDFLDLWRNRVEGGNQVASAPLRTSSPGDLGVTSSVEGDTAPTNMAGLGGGQGRRPMGLLSSLLGGGGGGSYDDTGDSRGGGLLGNLNNPDNLAAFAMIAKGLNPWSELNPMEFMRLAEQQRQRAADRADKQRQLDISQGHLDVLQQGSALAQRKFDEEQAQRRREEQALQDFNKKRLELSAPGTVPGVGPTGPVLPSAGLTEGATGSEADKIRREIKFFEDNMGSLPEKQQVNAQKHIDLLYKRLQPSATEEKLYQGATTTLPQLEAIQSDLERAKELVPQAASNAITSWADKLSSNLGENIAGKQAMATAELDRLMKSTALTELKKLLPGPASNRDVQLIEQIAADPGMSPTEKTRRIGNVLTRVESQIAAQKETIKKYRQKEGTYKGEFEPKKEEDTSGGQLPGGWTVRMK